MQIITQINNVKCLEWGLNANQGALFDMLNQSASWAKTVVIDGEVWYWVSRNKVIEELPLYYTKPDTVYRHLKALDKSGLVRHQKHGDKDLIMLTEKGKTWNNKVIDNLPQNNSKNDDKNSSDSNPTLGNKSENARIEIRNSSDSNPTYQHTNSSAVNNQERKSRKKEKIEILTFGEKVKLPLPAYEKLVAEFGELKIVEYIEKINTYLTTTEKGLKRGEYKNYAQTIKNWIASDSNGSSVGYSQQQAHAVAAWRQKAEFLSAGKKSGDWWAQPGEDNQTWAKRVVIWLKVGLDKHWDITRQNWRMETESQKAMVRKLYFHARDILQGRAA